MTDPRFMPGLRRLLDTRFAPDWTADAACAAVMRRSHTPGQLWEKAYKDETAQADAYDWSDAVLDVMRVCATCPVRPECTAYAYAEVDRVEVEESPEEAAYHQGRPRGEWADSDRRWGVYGGVPGRQRELLAETTCPDCGGAGVLEGFGDHLELGRALWPLLPGLPCRRCQRPGSGFPWLRSNPKGTGKVPAPDRVARSMAWFEAFARGRGWLVQDQEEETA